MTLHMLDTNIVSDMMRNPQGPVARNIERVGEDTLCVSVITAAELRYGAAKSGSASLAARVEAILNRLEVLRLMVPADAQYGRIRAELEVAGRPIGPNDLLIAAHAAALGAKLITANTAEFRRVRGLDVEDWTTAT